MELEAKQRQYIESKKQNFEGKLFKLKLDITGFLSMYKNGETGTDKWPKIKKEGTVVLVLQIINDENRKKLYGEPVWVKILAENEISFIWAKHIRHLSEYYFDALT